MLHRKALLQLVKSTPAEKGEGVFIKMVVLQQILLVMIEHCRTGPHAPPTTAAERTANVFAHDSNKSLILLCWQPISKLLLQCN